jgi:hypothetical protein
MYTKYNLTQPGIRALVDDAVEIGRSTEGYRQFRTVRDTIITVRAIEPTSQLLMREEVWTPHSFSTARHTWRKVTSGYVRDRTDIDAVDQIDGHSVGSHASIQILDVKIGGVAIQ